MTPDQHARIKEAFREVCEFPVGERTDVLRRVCGADEELFAAVQKLLLHDTEDTSSDSGSTVPVRRVDAGATAIAEPALSLARELPAGTVVAQRYRIVTLLGTAGWVRCIEPTT